MKKVSASVARETQHSTGRIRGLAYPFDLQCNLLEAETLPQVLEIAASMAARVPGTVGAWIFQRDADGQLVLVQQWQASHADQEPPSSDQLGKLIHQRWIAAHRLGQSSTEFARPFTPKGMSNLTVVPMLIGEELVGALAAQRRAGETFAYVPEDLVMLATIAALTAQQMQLTLLRDRAEPVDPAELRQEVLNEAQRHIAHELHDGIVQDLAYMRLRLELLERTIQSDPDQAAEQAGEIREQFNQAIENLRSTVNELRKPRQQTRGITGRLRDIAGKMAEQPISEQEPEIELDLSEISGVRLEPEVERAVVGIVREAMQNIRKHAGASSVHVEVQRNDDVLEVEVRDDGRGVPEEMIQDGVEMHFGVEQMKELAEDMGGSLSIQGQKGSGTRVQASIPLVPESRRR
ncbi:MAG: GAF domain-containing sensor histidine kinase [Chloroflexota bacterium]